MRLIIREYLGMLRESGEFDALIPDLLLAMKIVPLSKAQAGVRQAGVDIAAVGNDDVGRRTLWLFVLKRNDLGRRDWDNGEPQSVRPSLEEIKDIYLRNHVAPEHAALPTKIVVATTGEFKQDFEQNRVGYADKNTQSDRTYEFWNGDRVATLIEQHLFNEYILPITARSQLRRALALIGDPDYDLEHFFSLLKTLLTWTSDDTTKKSKNIRRCLRSLATTGLALGIVCRWSANEENLHSALLACERTLLWAWDVIQRKNLTDNKTIIRGYLRLVKIYLDTTVEYFNKVQPHLHTSNALARYHRESALLNERVFEEIGLLATIGLSHLLWGITTKNDRCIEDARVVGDSLHAFLKTHPCSGSPRYDGQSIDISLGLLLMLYGDGGEHAKAWLGDLASRLTYAFRMGRWFPISTDSFDDLVAIEIDRDDVDIINLKETSWMIPTVAQWAAALGEDQAYAHLVGHLDALKDTCFQLWYPDQKTAEIMYRGPAHYESGIAEAPVGLPLTADEMRFNMKKTRAESPVKESFESSASKVGFPWLDFIACRHFRTPMDPAFWQKITSEYPRSEQSQPTK